MRNISNKSCRENQNIRFIFSTVFMKTVQFMRKCRKIKWRQMPQMAIWRRVAYWISKAARAQAHSRALHPHPHTHARTHTHKYVILITFPQQHFFRERSSLSRYTYTACLIGIRETPLLYLRYPTVFLGLSR